MKVEIEVHPEVAEMLGVQDADVCAVAIEELFERMLVGSRAGGSSVELTSESAVRELNRLAEEMWM